MRGILFDIDGTLLRAAGAGRRALAMGASAVGPCSLADATAVLDTMDFRGRTDELLLEELIAGLGVSMSPADLAEAYLESLPRALSEGTVEALPGVVSLIEDLEQRDDVVVGILTGNIRPAARLKLETIDLHRLAEAPGGFGDDGRERTDLADRAKARMVEAGVRSDALMVVGDTHRDVEAGAHIGAKTVAVATGWTTEESLKETAADLVVRDLADATALLEIFCTL